MSARSCACRPGMSIPEHAIPLKRSARWPQARAHGSTSTALSAHGPGWTRSAPPWWMLDHLTDAQKRAYVIADNQLALNAGWDEEILGEELAALQAEEFNICLIGSEELELERSPAAHDRRRQTASEPVPGPPAAPA